MTSHGCLPTKNGRRWPPCHPDRDVRGNDATIADHARLRAIADDVGLLVSPGLAAAALLLVLLRGVFRGVQHIADPLVGHALEKLDNPLNVGVRM